MESPFLQPSPEAATSMSPAMALALDASFGSVGHWQDTFLALCKEKIGEHQGVKTGGTHPGWAQLLYLPHDATLVNRWAPQPTQATVDGAPLLAIDLGTAVDGDWDALVGSIAWADVYARYQQTIHHHSEACGVAAANTEGAMLLDVRREGVYQAATRRIAGAQWHNPATVAHWANSLPTNQEIVVYCVYGHEVSRATALRLRATGLKARYLQGGIDGWQAAGLPVETMDASPRKG